MSVSGAYGEHASELAPTSSAEGMYDEFFQHDAKAAQLREMLRNLQSLSWKRVGMLFHTPLCHNQAILKPYSGGSSDEVPRHVTRNFIL